MLRRLCRWFRFKDRTRDSLAEEYLILLKSARRCAYDLKHVIDLLPATHWATFTFKDRAKHWLMIFSPVGVKDYKLELHQTIDDLEMEVYLLRKKLQENGLSTDVGLKKEIPF